MFNITRELQNCTGALRRRTIWHQTRHNREVTGQRMRSCLFSSESSIDLRPSGAMAMSPRAVFLLFHAAFLLPVFQSKTFEHSTANLSTLWTNHPLLLRPSVTYPDGSTVRPLLLHGARGPSFAFGFYCSAPCHAFFLSIYIVFTKGKSVITRIKNIPPSVVWSANRGRPVQENATLFFSPNGDLVLRDVDGNTVWSSNTSGLGATALTLLNSGNLVVLDSQKRNLWASFDHPTDSLLLGQTLREGQRLTSERTISIAPVYLALQEDGLRAFVDTNPPQLYIAEPAVGSEVKGNGISYLSFNNNSLDLIVLLEGTGRPNLSFPLTAAPPSHQFLRLNEDGLLKQFIWNNEWGFINHDVELLQDRCGYPNVCGPYGLCSPMHCSCPQAATADSAFFKPLNASNTNLGCTLMTPISCNSMESHQLLTLENISYFNYADKFAAAMQSTEVEICKQACLRNCSCKAAFFRSYKASLLGSCYLPSEIFSLTVIEYNPNGFKSTAFLKVQLPLKAPGPSSTRLESYMDASPSRRRKNWVMGLISGSILASISVFVIILIRMRRIKDEDKFDTIPGMPARFSFAEIKAATENFKQKIGKGGFGTVFEGTLRNGTKVAVKRLDGVGQGKKEFLAEVETIGAIHHINLVRLIGFCAEKSHRFLVLEYMPNGSLDKWIFGRTNDGALDWETRRKIIIDIAKGLSYLHEECQHRIAHLDIKPQNILLDENFHAKVADFGMSKLIDRDESQVMTRMRGTPGYLAPEWLTSVITEKVDVYSFGVLLMEIMCGRMNLEPAQPKEDVQLLILLQEKLRANLLSDLCDKRSTDMQLHEEEAVDMMRLAIWCLQSQSSKRPPMSKVVKVLEGSSPVETNIDYDLFGSDYLFASQDAAFFQPMASSLLIKST
ncbi:hypothetical protein HPP92_005193 [Vanilla planifolia]|uniref:Receptor-like serine/threonine-protein kinase n=1 Tax=Vanilla planifolia TaxID=51239 RepID=A0A835RGD0_VANPL|nr:hypothetical protein HPP92_005193 [Vanilla planifolia]